PTRERLSWSLISSGVSISTSGPWTNRLGPDRLYGTPRARASTQTRQPQPGRGVVIAPPVPRNSICKARLSRGRSGSPTERVGNAPGVRAAGQCPPRAVDPDAADAAGLGVPVGPGLHVVAALGQAGEGRLAGPRLEAQQVGAVGVRVGRDRHAVGRQPRRF